MEIIVSLLVFYDEQKKVVSMLTTESREETHKQLIGAICIWTQQESKSTPNTDKNYKIIVNNGDCELDEYQYISLMEIMTRQQR